MASSTGTNSSQSIEDAMDERKRKRMISNRESARRSRQRKQSHLDELNAQVSKLRRENGQIIDVLKVTTQHYLTVEAENTVLKTQMMELTSRLNSLNEILNIVKEVYDDGIKPWSMMNMMSNDQPVVDMYQY